MKTKMRFRKLPILCTAALLTFSQTVPCTVFASEAEEQAEAQTLLEFCNDPELDEWFASLRENTPAKLDFWIYGEGPYDMVFTDPELILETADALQTVTIGGLAHENPDNVADGGGCGYYFEMADGTKKGFSFMLGTFRWNGSEYHDVASFGSLGDVNEKLRHIGNPQYVAALSEDAGFYTQHLETYRSEWHPEDQWNGGLVIFLSEEIDPHISIARVNSDETNPRLYLARDFGPMFEEDVALHGGSIESIGSMEEYSLGQETLNGVRCKFTKADRPMTLLVLFLETKDNLLREDHLIRFCAEFDESVPGEEEKVMTALDAAIKNFSLKHMLQEENAVQEGSYLLDFCNDPALNDWFDKAMASPENFELLFIQDGWALIEDPDTILAVLEALKNVKIGPETDEVVGNAEHRGYRFSDKDGYSEMEFDFNVNIFRWNNKKYEVEDWGTLKDIALK